MGDMGEGPARAVGLSGSPGAGTMPCLVQREGGSEDALAQQPVHPHLPLLGAAVLRGGQDLVELQRKGLGREGASATRIGVPTTLLTLRL